MADRGPGELQELDRVRRTVLEALGGGGIRRLQPALLQPAGELLARYGEELRGRACVVSDAHGGELFLLPDYTVPICRMHRERGGGVGRFLYAGPVFRLPDSRGGRLPIEEQQAGLEVFEERATPEADAEVLCRTIAAVRAVAGNPAVTLGDSGIGPAILDSFDISEPRRIRLLRRIGQPQRFRALLERFTCAEAGSDRMVDLEPFADPEQAETALAEVLATRNIPFIGRRSPEEVALRLSELAAEREEAPLSEALAARIEALLGLRGSFRPTLDSLKESAGESPTLEAAIHRLEDRAARLAQEGVDVRELALDLRLGAMSATTTVWCSKSGLTTGAWPAAVGMTAWREIQAWTSAQWVRRCGSSGCWALPRRVDRMPGLVLAYPSKGRLRPQADARFEAAGMPVRSVGASRSYALGLGGFEGVQLLLVEAAQVPGLLARGEAHAGLTGIDLVHEQLAEPAALLGAPVRLGFGAARIAVAVPECWIDVRTLADLDDVALAFLRVHGRRLRIATGFRRLASRFLTDRCSAPFELVPSRGPTEAAPLAGLAELVVDIVASGGTLRANHLRVPEAGTILESEACLWASRAASWNTELRETMERLCVRLGAAAE